VGPELSLVAVTINLNAETSTTQKISDKIKQIFRRIKVIKFLEESIVQTLSKALELSKKIPTAFFPLLIFSLSFWMKKVRLSEAPFIVPKPSLLFNKNCCYTRNKYSLVLSNYSVSLLRQLVRLIGLYLFIKILRHSPFFGIIIILAFFHSSGIPEAVDLFTKTLKTDLT